MVRTGKRNTLPLCLVNVDEDASLPFLAPGRMGNEATFTAISKWVIACMPRVASAARDSTERVGYAFLSLGDIHVSNGRKGGCHQLGVMAHPKWSESCISF